MSQHPSSSAGSASGDTDLSRTYALVLAIEVVVIVALYALGAYFG
jgi:hypothetical protein